MHFRKVHLNSLKRGLAMAAGTSPAHTAAKRAEAPVKKAAPVSPQSPKAVSLVAFVEPPRIAAPTIDVLAEVTRIAAETCDITASTIQPTRDLEAYGVEPLMSIKMLTKKQNVFCSADVNAHVLSSCRNAVQIVAEVSSKFSQEDSSSSSPCMLVTDKKLGEPSVIMNLDEVDIKLLLANILGISLQEITDDADFESLGLDLLTSFEAHLALQSEY